MIQIPKGGMTSLTVTPCDLYGNLYFLLHKFRFCSSRTALSNKVSLATFSYLHISLNYLKLNLKFRSSVTLTTFLYSMVTCGCYLPYWTVLARYIGSQSKITSTRKKQFNETLSIKLQAIAPIWALWVSHVIGPASIKRSCHACRGIGPDHQEEVGLPLYDGNREESFALKWPLECVLIVPCQISIVWGQL